MTGQNNITIYSNSAGAVIGHPIETIWTANICIL